ncbi:hypothetical protein QYE76_017986, partial [Lolium multiflorum]
NNDEDPATYEEAMMSPDSNKWQEAMKSEMGSMYDNKEWNNWTAVKNILKYLKRTKDMFLCYGGDQELVVTSYTDASWNTDPDDSKSQSGYVFILNGAAVSWASSKQCTVAKSSTESEYIAASEASSEVVWMKRFIVELGVVPSALDPLIIYCDNMGAIANAQEPRSHKGLKHIKLRYHSIREYIEDGEVKICKVHTDLNVADPLTKALPRAKHDQHQNAMGVSLAKLRRTSSPPPTPRRRAAGFKRSYCFRCPLEGEVDVVFINTERVTAVSPGNKRKRSEAVDTGTSKAAEEVAPTEEGLTLNPYDAALVSSDEEGDDPAIDVTARTSTSRTLVVSEAQPDGDETSTPQRGVELTTPAASPRAPSPKRARVEPVEEPTQLEGGFTTSSLNDPLMKEFFRLGTQFVGYRDLSDSLKASLAEANKCADALALKLEQSKKARKKAESSAAVVEELRKRLHDAETSLSDHITQQTAHENEIITRLSSQCRRFVRKTRQPYDLENPENDALLDTLSLLEIHGDEARQGMEEADSALAKLFPFFFPKKEEPKTFGELAKCFNAAEDLGHNLRQEGLKVGVEGTIALVAISQQNVDWAKVGDVPKMETKTWVSLIKAAKPNSKKILAFLGFKPTPAPSSSKPEVK